METAMTPCSFIRYDDGEIDTEPDSSPRQVRRASLQRITASLLVLAPNDSGIFEVMVPVSHVIKVDIDRYGYNQPAATRVRAHIDTDPLGCRCISGIEVEGPDQDWFQPRAEYRMFNDGGVMFSFVWAVSNRMMAQIDQALSAMVENLNSPAST